MTDAPTAWRRVSPLSLLFFAADIAKHIVRNFVQVGIPTIAFLVTTGGFTQERLYLIGAAIVALALFYAFAMFLNTRFSLSTDGVVLRTGVFARKQLNVEYGRIQALNLSQNPIYRWFGLYDLAIDSAGSTDSEIVLPAVPDDVIAELRSRIGSVERTRPLPVADSAAAPEAALLQLSALDMVRIGISSERSLVFLAVVGSAFGALQSQDWAERQLARLIPGWIRDIELVSLTEWLLAALAGLAGVIALLTLFSIAGAFFKYFRYTLFERGAEYVARAGLITLRTQTLPIRKAQRVDVVRGVVHRRLRRCELSVQQAAGKEHDEKGEFVLPLVDDETLKLVTTRLLDDNATGFLRRDASGVFQPINRYYWLANWRWNGFLPAAISAALILAYEQPPELLALSALWLVGSGLVYWQRLRRWGYFVFRDGLAVRRGLFGERIEVLLWRKVQYVSIRQTWFLERKGLSHLHIATAAGSRRLPFIPASLAESMADKALYRAESTAQAWI